MTSTTMSENKLPKWIHASTIIGAIYLIVLAAAYFSRHMGVVFDAIQVGIFIIAAMIAISAVAILKSNPSLTSMTAHVLISAFLAAIIMASGQLIPASYIPPNSKIIATATVSKVDPITNLGATSYRLETDIGTTTLNSDIASTGDTLNLTKKTSNDGEIEWYYVCSQKQDKSCSIVPNSDLKWMLQKIPTS